MATMTQKILSRFPRRGSVRSRSQIYRSIHNARSATLDEAIAELLAAGKIEARTVNGDKDARYRTTMYRRV